MTVENKNEIVRHPKYDEFKILWQLQLDCFAGEYAVKKQGRKYLPLPSGKVFKEIKDGPESVRLFYDGYKMSADFPEILEDAVDSMKGQVFEDSGKIELPEQLKYLLDCATRDGRKLATFERDLLERQLVTGRCFCLWTVDKEANNLKLVTYDALQIVDWRVDAFGNLKAIVLDESTTKVVNGTWSQVEQFRVCAIDAFGFYYTCLVEDTKMFDFNYPGTGAIYEDVRKRKFRGIPGLIVNSVNIGADVCTPVTIRISESSLRSYINSARLEQSLDITGQPTLYTINAKLAKGQSIQLGSSVALAVENPEAKPEIGILETTGISFEAMRNAIADHKKDARRNIELIEQGAEAGVALNTRLSVKTASLQNVALALQESMVRLLRMAATWMAVDGSGIVVLVNTDFRKDDLLTQDLVQLATLVNMGLMAKKDVFFCLKKAKRTQFETFEEWSAHTDEFGLVSGVNVNENGQ